jgi:beta-phosphoglucomutase
LSDYKNIVEILPEIKAIILDMDGVLVDSEPYHVQSFKIFMDELNLSYDESYIYTFIGHSIRSNIESINQKFIHDDNFDLDKAVQRRDEIYVGLIKQADLKPLPGIDALLDLCLQMDIIPALASSSTREQVDVILKKLSDENRNLYKIFKSVVTGDDVKNRKPAPDIYEITLNNLKISARQSLAIEDSPAGVQAAKNAGIYCIGLKSHFISPGKLSKADYLISEIDEITKHIRNN